MVVYEDLGKSYKTISDPLGSTPVHPPTLSHLSHGHLHQLSLSLKPDSSALSRGVFKEAPQPLGASISSSVKQWVRVLRQSPKTMCTWHSEHKQLVCEPPHSVPVTALAGPGLVVILLPLITDCMWSCLHSSLKNHFPQCVYVCLYVCLCMCVCTSVCLSV